MKNEKIKKTKAELEIELKDQLVKLNNACNQFDNENISAAKDIVKILGALLYEYEGSKPLLGQLNLRNYFYDSAEPFNKINLLTVSGLVMMKVKQTPDGSIPFYKPRLEKTSNKNKKVSFADWWNAPVMRATKNKNISRRELVRNVVNTEGERPELACLRQIAYEVIQSLANN